MAELTWNTVTMAELHYKQGHIEQALEIYREVLSREPNNANVQARISELTSILAPDRGASMGFREHIQHIVDATPGAVACTIMGFDGIAIDTYQVGGIEIDLPTLLVEYSSATQQLRHNSTQSFTGPLVEMLIRGELMTTVFRLLTDEYFLAVVLKPSALIGKARYLMRLANGPIAKELS
ncbi:MAG: tetratricopeptide repeat protein [Deltaproteobacteria bacterium]|nr:tetratricopeptide repeat protein [Deltaproteobacteria bacterium]